MESIQAKASRRRAPVNHDRRPQITPSARSSWSGPFGVTVISNVALGEPPGY
jgi:hypothetical protein